VHPRHNGLAVEALKRLAALVEHLDRLDRRCLRRHVAEEQLIRDMHAAVRGREGPRHAQYVRDHGREVVLRRVDDGRRAH
jgi:hypothetical protein